MSMLEPLLMLIFLLGSWFFSGFECGIVALNRHRLLHLIRHGDKTAKKLARILKNSHRMIATTLVGNNICNVSMTTLASVIGYRIAQETGQSVATFIIAIVSLVACEFLPKLWFNARPIARTRKLIQIFLFFQFLLAPLASLCLLLTRIFDRKTNVAKSPFISRDTINFLSQDSELNGKISAFERVMIKQVLDLQLLKAYQVMKPISQVVKVYENDNRATCLRVFRMSHHKFVPVFTDDGVTCLGYLSFTDMLRYSEVEKITDLLRMPVFVSRDTPADDLLPYMRAKNKTLIFVRNENTKRVVGIVTQDDVLHSVIDDELLHSSTERRVKKTAKVFSEAM